MKDPGARVIVLDAMGVIYRSRDDVAELLVPFVAQHGSTTVPRDVAELYESASLGELEADGFWRAVGLDPAVEDDYLAGHELSEGALAFLDFARSADIVVWCLSNDVSRWSVKLRQRFGLDRLFAGFVISGDIGHRKPSRQSYRCLLERIGTTPELFVDDRPANVTAARAMGIRSVCFGPDSPEQGGVRDFSALTVLIGTSDSESSRAHRAPPYL